MEEFAFSYNWTQRNGKVRGVARTSEPFQVSVPGGASNVAGTLQVAVPAPLPPAPMFDVSK